MKEEPERRRSYRPDYWRMQRERLRISAPRPPEPLRHTKRVDEVLAPVLGGMGLEDAFRVSRLHEDWAEIAGRPVADHTRPGRLEGDRLVVYVDHPMWMSELSRFGKGPLLEKVRRYVNDGSVQDLVLKIDPGRRPGSTSP
ncbi:DUF721 domain-containing protein [Kiritimatiella glycovorans]|uniref:DUF721 domain-containing protein n=1 Tax=Kiritimatiella glycovorans TaxID=1307763 RepID=UPI00191C56C8|nr:DUF721 domain-containing protein [Kiritimatiella glycovorans]